MLTLSLTKISLTLRPSGSKERLRILGKKHNWRETPRPEFLRG